MLRNTHYTYGFIAQALHWAAAILIFGLLAIGFLMQEIPTSTVSEVAEKSWAYSLHKTTGLFLLVIVSVRVAWSLTQSRPKPLHPDRLLETQAARTVHWVLYGCMVLMPVTGYLHHVAADGFAPVWGPFPNDLSIIPDDPDLSEGFANIHATLGILFAGAVILHIAGALKHALVDRDTTLRRMLPGAPDHGPIEAPVCPLPNWPPAALAILILSGAVGSTFVTSLPIWSDADQELAFTPATGLNAWEVNHGNSSLTIGVLQSGTPVSGRFARWSGVIHFDPEDLETASALVEVDIASLYLGSVGEAAVGPDFLNAPAFPVARFEATDFTALGGDMYEARGTLTLLDATRPLIIPFDLRIQDGRATMKGRAVVNRLDYGIGSEAFPTGDLVGLEVAINIELDARRVR